MPPPAQPAQVSGPGPMSRRTDGGAAQAMMDLPNAKYGENSQFQSLQQGASLSASPSPTGTPVGMDANGLPPNPAASQVVPIGAPTNRPNEPVTSGAALGAGPGPASLGINPGQVERQDLSTISTSMPLLEYLANMPDALPSSRLLVNLIKSGAS